MKKLSNFVRQMMEINGIEESELCAFGNCHKFIVDKKTGCCSFHSVFANKDIPKIKKIIEEADEVNKIYFILAEDVNKVKIGRTFNLDERLSTLQISSPFDLKIICHLVLEKEYEGVFHKFFKEDSVRGEWFEYSEDIKTFIDLAETKGEKGVEDFFEKFYGANADE